MPLIIREEIIAVDDPHRVVQLQAVFKAQPAPGVDLEHPAFVDLGPDAGRYLDRLPRLQADLIRQEDIISGAPGSSPPGELDPLVDL